MCWKNLLGSVFHFIIKLALFFFYFRFRDDEKALSIERQLIGHSSDEDLKIDRLISAKFRKKSVSQFFKFLYMYSFYNAIL
jgi:hypothetical protein